MDILAPHLAHVDGWFRLSNICRGEPNSGMRVVDVLPYDEQILPLILVVIVTQTVMVTTHLSRRIGSLRCWAQAYLPRPSWTSSVYVQQDTEPDV